LSRFVCATHSTAQLRVGSTMSLCNYFVADADPVSSIVFFFHDTAPTEIYTLSLHDALPIFVERGLDDELPPFGDRSNLSVLDDEDRKSTRLNSSHLGISYAVFCLKKKTIDRRCHTSVSSDRRAT